MICKLILIFYKFILILGINIEYAHKICVKYQETFETKKAVHFWEKKGFFFPLPLVLLSPGVEFIVGLEPRVSNPVFVSRRSIKM